MNEHIVPFQVLFFRMPPVRRKKASAGSTGLQSMTQGQRAAPRWGLHSGTARSTFYVVSSGAPLTTSSSPAVTVASPAPTVSEPSLSPDLISTLVSSVTNAVTQQLSALLPTSSAIAMSPPGAAPPSSTSPDSLVNTAMATAHSIVTGQPHPFTLPSSSELFPQQPFHSTSLPLDARVIEKIKARIWNEEFVDLGALVSNPDPNTRYKINFRPCEIGQSASLVLEPTAKSKQIKSISDWLWAFHIFVAVYTKKYPHESPALMKYGQIVQDLAARGHNWFYYDEHFCFLRQTQVTQVPWATVHWELWLWSQNAAAPRSTAQGQQPSRLPNNLSIPRGYCYKFHRGTYRSGCAFKHVCFKCSKAHHFVNCNFRGADQKSPNE